MLIEKCQYKYGSDNCEVVLARCYNEISFYVCINNIMDVFCGEIDHYGNIDIRKFDSLKFKTAIIKLNFKKLRKYHNFLNLLLEDIYKKSYEMFGLDAKFKYTTPEEDIIQEIIE